MPIIKEYVETVRAFDRSRYSELMLTITNEIISNLAQNITLASTAKKFGLSASALAQKFRRETGFTFHHYMNYFRILMAKYYITSSNLNMTEIAQSVGYANSNYFSRIFKEIAGMTPTEYKILELI